MVRHHRVHRLIVPVSLQRIVVFDIHTEEEVDATIAVSQVLREFWLQIFRQIKEITFQIDVLLAQFEIHLLNHTTKSLFQLHDRKSWLHIHDIRAKIYDGNLVTESWSEICI